MLAATADQLLDIFREEVSDQVEPFLWSSQLLYVYMTEAVDAVANDGQVMEKTLRLGYSKDDPVVRLPASVLEIRSVHDVATKRALYAANTNEAIGATISDYGRSISGPSAMFAGSGFPSLYVRDYEAKALRLVPIPNLDGTLEMQCSVTLSVPMCEGASMPLSNTRDQRLVLHYMKWRAYSKHDAETEDLVRAKENERQYLRGVEMRNAQNRNYRRTPGVVRMEW